MADHASALLTTAEVRGFSRLVFQIRPGVDRETCDARLNLLRLCEDLEGHPEKLAQLRHLFVDLVKHRDFVPLLTESGLMVHEGFLPELIKRVEYRILPKALEPSDFTSIIQILFATSNDHMWVEQIDDETWVRFFRLLVSDASELTHRIYAQLLLACEILSLRLAVLGMQPLVASRLKESPQLQNALLEQNRCLQNFLTLIHQGGSSADDQRFLLQQMDGLLDQCFGVVGFVRNQRARLGISLHLTFQLLRIGEVVQRLRTLIGIILASGPSTQLFQIVRLFKELVRAENQRFDLREYVQKNIELLAFQITEHTGRTGEHYITSTLLEYKAMFRSAVIGGVVVGFLCVTRLLLSYLGLPLAIEAIAMSLNYAIGFIIIHSLGGTLATKQPAMTASKIAASMDQAKTSQQALEQLTETIVRTTRSQFVALTGNFAVAFPVAVVLGGLFMLLRVPLLNELQAHSILADLHPFKSLTLFYAAIAGCFLFISGLLAGAANNWFVVNQVAERLETATFLRRLVPANRLRSAIEFIDENFGFWVGNLSLGVFLGSAHTFGVLFGLPFDIRHITFMSGSVGMAMMNLKFQVAFLFGINMLLGVVLVGLVNLAVSFSLTLILALRSRSIRFTQTGTLLRLCWQRLRESPMDFIYPPSQLKTK